MKQLSKVIVLSLVSALVGSLTPPRGLETPLMSAVMAGGAFADGVNIEAPQASPGNSQVVLNWNASTGATSYNVYRGTTSGGESTTPIASSLTATTYTDTGLTNGTAYYYKVKAVNSYGTSPYSNEAHATPGALALKSVVCSPTGVYGGKSFTVTVTLNGAAATGGTPVSVSSSDGHTIPSGTVITVPAGATSAALTVSTSPIATTSNLTITASEGGVTLTATENVMAPILSAFSATSSVTSGQGVTIAVALSSPAVAGGTAVTLTSNSSVLPVSKITVLGSQGSASMGVVAGGVSSATTVTLTATLNGSSKTATVTVNPSGLSSITVTPTSGPGGTSILGRVTLGGPAGPSGTTVALSSSSASVTVPSSILVPAGSATVTFAPTALAVDANTAATISATLGSVTKTATFTVNPSTLASVTVSPTSVYGGVAFSIAPTLTSAAGPSGRVVKLTSSDGKSVPAGTTVTIPAGAKTASISETAYPVKTTAAVTISANSNNITKTATLTDKSPDLSLFTLSPTTLKSGQSLTVHVVLKSVAPTGGTVVPITSNSSAIAITSVTVPAGSTSTSVLVTAGTVTANTPVTLTATLNGVSDTGSVTVQP